MNKFAYIALVFGVAQAVKLSKSDFMTDEQYQALHAKALFEKENPMADFEEQVLLKPRVKASKVAKIFKKN